MDYRLPIASRIAESVFKGRRGLECSREFISSHPLFREHLSKLETTGMKDVRYCLLYDELGRDVLFVCDGEFPVLISFAHELRVSFHDEKPTLFLYDLRLSRSGPLQLEKIRLHKLSKTGLIEQVGQTMVKSQENGVEIYSFGKETPLQIAVKINNSKSWIEVHGKSNLLFEASIKEMSKSPIETLKTYLHFDYQARSDGFQRRGNRAILEFLEDLSEKLDHEKQLEWREILRKDVILMTGLSRYYIFHMTLPHMSQKVRHFMEFLLSSHTPSNLIPIPLSKASDTFAAYHIKNTTRDSILLRASESTDLNLDRLVLKGLEILDGLVNDHADANDFCFEFVHFKSRQELLQALEKAVKQKRPSNQCYRIICILKRDDQSFSETLRFRLEPSGELKEEGIPIPYPLIIPAEHVPKSRSYTVEFDSKNSGAGRYSFYALKNSDKKECRLFHYALLGELDRCWVNLDDELAQSFDLIEASIKSSQYGTPLWNQILIKSLPSLEINDDEFKKMVEDLVQNNLSRLHSLSIERIFFQVPVRDGPTEGYNILEAHGILSGVPKYRLHNYLDGSGSIFLFEQSEEEEPDIHQAYKRNVFCARYLPPLIDRIAAEVRGDKNEVEETFRLLRLNPSTIKIDPKTGNYDPNYGELENAGSGQKINAEGLVIGIQTNRLSPDASVSRLLIASDMIHCPSLTPKECTWLNAAFKYAKKHDLPVEWYAGSFGAEISMESGVENLDACAATAREIVKLSRNSGQQIHIIVDCPNVGAQAYWNALGAILPQTKGLLIMTRRGTMVLTGARALMSALRADLSSEDLSGATSNLFPNGNHDLGGYPQVYGPNGEAPLFVENLDTAVKMLLAHYHLCSRKPPAVKEEHPLSVPKLKLFKSLIKKIQSRNLIDRRLLIDILEDDGNGCRLNLWGHINAKAGADPPGAPQPHTTIVSETVVGGHSVMVICPPIGPLTPADSKVIARAIFKADNAMPVVIIGSLTGYSSDPLAMRREQLGSGALIIEAIVNFRGKIVVVNLGSMVGGICVTFSKQLNPDLTIIAAENSRFQVVGGSLASKLVFKSSVRKKLTDLTEKSRELGISPPNLQKIEEQEAKLYDETHSAERALKTGCIDYLAAPEQIKSLIVRSLSEKAAAGPPHSKSLLPRCLFQSTVFKGKFYVSIRPYSSTILFFNPVGFA